MADLKKMPVKQIGLDKLRPSPDRNVRSGHDGDVAALAAAIAACGLLQNLIVHPLDERGLYGVSAGGRRLAALRQLRDEGVIAADHKVNCVVIDTDDALQASLAENFAREAMNSADEARAFRRLLEDGKRHAEIAAAFGVTERHVKARERLGRLAAPVFAAFQSRALSIEQAQAFAVVDDAARQEAVFAAWSKGPSWDRGAPTIRRMMLETRVSANSRLGRFVGRDAYVAAGGGVDEDLFGEEVYFTDAALLETVATRLLDAAADVELAKGWKWAAVMLDLDFGALRGLGRLSPAEVALDESDQARWDEIAARLEAEELDDETAEALQCELEALDDKTRAFTPEQMATAGVVVFLTHDGRIGVEAGLQRAEDRVALRPAAPEDEDASPDGDVDGEAAPVAGPAPSRVVLSVGDGAPEGGSAPGGATEPAKRRDPYSDALRADLRMALQGALQIAVAEDPALARDLVEFETVMQARADHGWRDGLLSLRVMSSTARLRCDGWRFDEAALDLPAARVDDAGLRTADAAGAFAAFRALPRADRDALLAAAVADMVQAALPADRGCRQDVAGDWGALARATLRLAADAPPEIRRIWTPTRDNFLARVSKAILLEIVEATLGAAEARLLMGAKKGELVDHLHAAFNDGAAQERLDAEQRARLAAWVPAPLRLAAAEDAGAAPDQPDAAAGKVDGETGEGPADEDGDDDGGAPETARALAAE